MGLVAAFHEQSLIAVTDREELAEVSLRDRTPYSGTLIVFDGLDGSGKTTQAKLLAEQLRVTGPVSVLRASTDRFRFD